MSNFGYSYVTKDALVGFKETLQQPPWSLLDPLERSSPEDRALWLQATWFQVQRALLWEAVEAVIGALDMFEQELFDKDADWDAVQRQFSFGLMEKEADRDPKVSQAAARLRVSMLEGGTTAQTRLTYQAEVDFGRKQVETGAQPLVLADLETVGMVDRPERIKRTTDALAETLARNLAHTRRLSLSQARHISTSTFNNVHGQLIIMSDLLAPGPQRDQLNALLATLNSLLLRR